MKYFSHTLKRTRTAQRYKERLARLDSQTLDTLDSKVLDSVNSQISESASLDSVDSENCENFASPDSQTLQKIDQKLLILNNQKSEQRRAKKAQAKNFENLKTRLKAGVMGKGEFINYINEIRDSEFQNALGARLGAFLDDDIQLELLRASGFPFVIKDEKIHLATALESLQNTTFCFVDIETTGGRPEESQVIEVGALKWRNGQVLERFESLIFAPSVPSEITDVTGLDAQDLANAPLEREVLKEFRPFLQDCVFVAHNVGFDYNFLSHRFRLYALPGLLNAKLCTIELARKTILSRRYSLSYLNDFLGINNVSHRAYADALGALEVFKIALMCIPNNIKTAQDLIDFSKGASF